MQGNPKVSKCRRSDAGRTHFESIHTKTEAHRKDQCRSRTVCSSIGSVGSKESPKHDARLGLCSEASVDIDAKATEHILHGQGIGKLKHTDVAHLWVQDEIRSQRLRVHRVRSEEHVADLGTIPLSKAVIAKHCLTLGYVNMDAGSFLR